MALTYKESVESRLVSRLAVDSQTGCWQWTGPVNAKGYANMGVHIPGRKKELASIQRVAAWLWLGVDLDGPHEVCHTCDNPSCANPDHLIAGTKSQNQKEAYARGLQPSRRGEANPNSKLTAKQVAKIQRLYSTGKYSQTRLARAAGISQVRVSQIVRGESWK